MKKSRKKSKKKEQMFYGTKHIKIKPKSKGEERREGRLVVSEIDNFERLLWWMKRERLAT